MSSIRITISSGTCSGPASAPPGSWQIPFDKVPSVLAAWLQVSHYVRFEAMAMAFAVSQLPSFQLSSF